MAPATGGGVEYPPETEFLGMKKNDKVPKHD